MENVTENDVRVHYSGFIIFGAKLISVATGMAFTLLITRNTTSSDYGVWANIFDLITYFAILATSIPFWTTRFVAHGKEGATKTGLVANLAIAAVSTACYLPLAFVITAFWRTSAYLIIYLVGAIQITNIHVITALEGSLRALKPQTVGYGLLIEEASKVSLAYVLIVVLQQPLLGAMISLMTAMVIQAFYYMKILSGEFKQRIQWGYVREWLRGSVANIYQAVGNQIAAFVFILLLSYGTAAARGNYQAAATIANIIAYSSFLSFALYPKLLAEGKTTDIATSLKMVLMFAIPMTAGAMAIPDSFLIILNEPYAAAAPILLLLAIDAFVVTISQFYTNVLFGVERLDEEARIPFKQLAKSSIFKVFTLPYVHAAITLPTTLYVLTTFAPGQLVQAAVYVAAINMTARITMFLVLYTIMRKSVKVVVPWRSVGKYVFASTVMAATLYLLPHQTRILWTLVTAALGAGIYLALLLAIDKEARVLAVSIVQEIEVKSRKKG